MDNPLNKKKFNIEEEERNVSPEKLNESIRIGSPGGILLITALVIAAVGMIVWGFVGSIPVTITEPVAVIGRETESKLCIGVIDVAENTGILPPGTEVNIRMPDGKTEKAKITLMSAQPVSSEEFNTIYGGMEAVIDYYMSDWMTESLLGDSKYVYPVLIETENDVSVYWHQIAEGTVIVGEVKPISLLVS